MAKLDFPIPIPKFDGTDTEIMPDPELIALVANLRPNKRQIMAMAPASKKLEAQQPPAAVSTRAPNHNLRDADVDSIVPIVGAAGSRVKTGGELTAERLTVRHHDYDPCPAIGKEVRMPGWQDKCYRAEDAAIRAWSKDFRNHTNTGILTRNTVAVDIDVLDERVADQIEALVIERHGKTPLRRVGKAPKRAVYYRAEKPFKKLVTSTFTAPDGIKHRVEFLGDGQQSIVLGVHPETKQEYSWANGKSPLNVKRSELPEITKEAAQETLAEIELLLRASFGAPSNRTRKLTELSPSKGRSRRVH
jgi:hypothetical protein